MENEKTETVTEPREAPRKEYTLKKEHEHGGRIWQEGDKIKLRADQAERLKKQGKI